MGTQGRTRLPVTPRQLVLFDIDGTLTQTTEVDADCYVRALAEVFGFADVNTDWSAYPHVTDSGGLQELFRIRKGRGPHPEEEAAFREHFVALLTASAAQQPFQPIAGAGAFLQRLAASPAHCVALATGAWSDSARLKLASAGMQFDDYPSASADDAVAREDILRLAMQRASRRAGADRFASVVYVGDGVWDARACRALGWPFMGIADGPKADQLRAEGAVGVCADFLDVGLLLEQLGRIGLLDRHARPSSQ